MKHPILLAVVAAALGALAYAVGERALHVEHVARIGFLGIDAALQAPRVESLKEGLLAAGYVEGRDYAFEYRWSGPQQDRLPQLAAELVDAKVDVIVTALPSAIRAAQRATHTVPIVMTSNDPVGLGFIENFAHPGANITGPAHPDLQLSIKRLDILRQAVPGLRRVAILWNIQGFGPDAWQVVDEAAKSLEMETLVLEVKAPEDIAAALAAAKSWGAQGVAVVFSPMFGANRRLLIDLLAANQLPTICDSRFYAVDGCLMSYGANIDAAFRRMGYYIDRILKGAKPQDLPVELTREYDYVINLKTAKSFGMVVSPELMVQATEVIR